MTQSHLSLSLSPFRCHRAPQIFMVCVLYTDKYAGDRMQLATLFRKGGAVAMDVRHMFEEKGVVEARLAAPAADDEALGADALLERCTEDAIEADAEEAEVLDAEARKVLVSFFFFFDNSFCFIIWFAFC